MIQVEPGELRRVADQQDLVAAELDQLLADTRARVLIGDMGVGDAQLWLSARMDAICHLIADVSANHRAVARGLRRAAEVYTIVDHPRVRSDGRMAR